MTPRSKYYVSLVAVALLIIGGLYCLLWMFAAADMSFVACDNEFSLFSPIPRCRRPYIAMILAAVLLVSALIIGLRAHRRI